MEITKRSPELVIGFDASHDNKFFPENPAFSDFIEYLFNSNFKVGKIEAGLNYEKISMYNIFMVGNPTESFTLDEMVDLVRYVKDGGSLLAINDKGENYLNPITKNFGIYFNFDKLFDKKQYVDKVTRPIIDDFERHFITRGVSNIIYSNGTTLKIDKSIEEDESIDFKIDVNAIIFSSKESSWKGYLNNGEIVEEPAPKSPLLAVAHFGLGKVVALGNLSLFSSLDDTYGINAMDNFKLVSNIPG